MKAFHPSTEVGTLHSSDDLYPRLLPAESASARTEVETLICSRRAVFIFDTLTDQLAELIRTRHAGPLSAADVALLVDEHLAGVPPSRYGTWVYYPWSLRLVHVLPEAQFAEVRGSGNRKRLAPERQAELETLHIGIVGLTVGHASAIALAMGGTGGELRLADSGRLGLSSTSRLRTGVHNIGINRAVLTAREIFEIDPYARVSIFADELKSENLQSFLHGEAPLDLLIEECDEPAMKVRLREEAQRRGIPIMETSGRGIPDMESYWPST